MAEIFLLLLAAILVVGTGGLTLIQAATGRLGWDRGRSQNAKSMTKAGLTLAIIGSAIVFGPMMVLSIMPYWIIACAVVFGGFKLLDVLFIREDKPGPAPRPVIEVEGFPVINQPVILASQNRFYYLTPIQDNERR
jgi:hypothetical protein